MPNLVAPTQISPDQSERNWTAGRSDTRSLSGIEEIWNRSEMTPTTQMLTGRPRG